MTKEQPITSEGKRFAALLKKRDMGSSEFARKVGFGTLAQNVNNWMRRGVPATHANLVAHMLGCRPEEISQVIPAPDVQVDREPMPALSDGQRMVLTLCEGFGPKQFAALAQAATWILEGRELKPGDFPNKKLPAAADKSAKRMSQ